MINRPPSRFFAVISIAWVIAGFYGGYKNGGGAGFLSVWVAVSGTVLGIAYAENRNRQITDNDQSGGGT